VVGKTKNSFITPPSTNINILIMPSAAEIKQQIAAAREAARKQEEELARAMAVAEEAERVAAEAEARRIEAERIAEAEAARVAEEARRQAVILARSSVPAEAGSSRGAGTADSACWNCTSRKLECVRSGTP
jgi:heptaprenylglyceryl phosphate synthase